VLVIDHVEEQLIDHVDEVGGLDDEDPVRPEEGANAVQERAGIGDVREGQPVATDDVRAAVEELAAS
jgi:hypothetical protein